MMKSKRITGWAMWAHRYESDLFMHASEDKGWVEMHGLDDPVVEVCVRESPKGEYWGWIDVKGTVPCMILKGKKLFDVCFPYGPEIEERAGKGRIVRLDVTEVGAKG